VKKIFLLLGIISIFYSCNKFQNKKVNIDINNFSVHDKELEDLKNFEIEQNNALINYKNEFPYEDIFFISKMIRGQEIINEINNYYKINSDYPKFHSLDQTDRMNLLNIYRKAFPNEDVHIGGFSQQYTQPYYEERNFQPKYYIIYYKIGWSHANVWDWLFLYDSRTKIWKISYMQY
jgi:hypothetical protein